MRKTLCVSTILLFVSISPAYAYIDPGVGSMLLQGLVGGIAAGLAILSAYYQKIKTFFGSLFSKKQANSELEKESVNKEG